MRDEGNGLSSAAYTTTGEAECATTTADVPCSGAIQFLLLSGGGEINETRDLVLLLMWLPRSDEPTRTFSLRDA